MSFPVQLKRATTCWRPGPCEPAAESVSRQRSLNAAIDCVVGARLFSFARNKPRFREMMLQVPLGGTAPEVGGRRSAFPFDCFPRSTSDGMLVMGDEVSETNREALRSPLVRERKNFEGAFTRGETPGYLRWIPGCPVRVSLRGVSENRLSVLTPEPASRELWTEVTSNRRNVQMASLGTVDELTSPTESFAQRAKQPSAGGYQAVYSSETSAQAHLPAMWTSHSIRQRGAGPFVNGNIAEPEMD